MRLAALASAADAVVTPSRWLADEVRLQHPAARLQVVPPLFDAGVPRGEGWRARLNALGLLPGHFFCLPFTPRARELLPLVLEAFNGVPAGLEPQLVLLAPEEAWDAGPHLGLLDEDEG